MKKFSEEEKLMAVKKYLSNEGSFKRIGDSIGADEGDVRSWVQRFQYHGNEAFKNSYARYSVKDKLDVLTYMKEQGTSIRETAGIYSCINCLKSPTVKGFASSWSSYPNCPFGSIVAVLIS